jgi:hypothetical protein
VHDGPHRGGDADTQPRNQHHDECRRAAKTAARRSRRK